MKSSRRSLRRFLLLWSGAIALAFLLLALDAGVALHRLNAVSRDEMAVTNRLQLVNDFEVAALEANRNPQPDKWGRADSALRSLQRDQSAAPNALLPIVESYKQLKTTFDPSAPWSDEHGFLDAFRAFRRAESARIESEIRTSGQFDQWSRLAILALSGVALVGLVVGGSELWARVFKPTLALSQAAKRFGQGDLTARVAPLRDDELGELGDRFNDMADAIAARERERLRFVAAVAHDLKNPLVVIGGVAYLLRDKAHKFSPAEQSEWLDKVARNATRMEAMIFDLTDAVQVQTGTLKLNVGPCDFAQLVREGVEETALSFPDHCVRFEGSSTLSLQGDRARLERVIANLLSNAAKYSARGTTVTAHLDERGGAAVLEVRDEGTGIAPDDVKRLFTPFVRLEHTEKMASGTGLGLATVKKIIEAHGGRIEVESELRKGTTFRAFVPLQSSLN